MKAYVVENGLYTWKEMEEPSVHPNEVKVKLITAGMNHRDLMIKERVQSQEAFILGSDGAGIVEAIGENVTKFHVGDEVIINPGLNWYNKNEAPPEEFEIVGVPYNGTFAEKIVIHEDFVAEKPSHLSWEEAGVFSLAALTGYRALCTQGQAKKGETLFIPGVSGGVNTFIIQFAKAIGLRVITTSRTQAKLDMAIDLKYDRGLETEDDWVRELHDETVDLVIESIGGKTFNRSLEVLKKGGRIVTYGSSTDDIFSFNLRQFFYGQYHMIGSTMGSREEFIELLAFVKQHNIKPFIDTSFSFDELDRAFTYLEKQNQVGKIVVRFND
ncbi:zinc-binding dehydrogenase [Gracilibacillus marinus]|jgi:zinc-binding alcohol dehydrogenase/oxidoreductase|uniref:Zinc-binding dehydrogenase n=1 Tax=Gracilibacillus marinus TaxID=630535 RepID=A0ABV8VVX9_9BACI